jgi:hypothetical protein
VPDPFSFSDAHQMEFDVPALTIENLLDPAQMNRVAALAVAKDMLTRQTPMGSSAVKVDDLVDLAGYILTGYVDPGVRLPEHPIPDLNAYDEETSS